MMKIALTLLSLFFISSTSQAFLSLNESGEILPLDKYQVGFEPQLITSRDVGGTANVFFDTAFNESTSGRISMGAGVIDFNAFASVKWIPYPDFDNQPAMGLRGGVGMARDEDENFLEAQIAPLVSKRFDTIYGLSVPYAAVSFTLLNTKDDNIVASNLVIGSEFHYTEWNAVTLGGEVGLDLNKSYSYISLFMTFPFDSQKGFGN